MASHWNTEYYDIMNFYYWEPQHLGKKRYAESPYKSKREVMDHLKRMEVTLNHQFNLFFRLLPGCMYTDFFESIIPGLAKDDYQYQSNDNVDMLGLKDATQPDLFFVGRHSLIGVELKLGAKTTLEQVLKYAMLFYFEQKRSGLAKECHLVYFGCGGFSNLSREKHADAEELRRTLSVELLPDTTRKGGTSLLGEKEAIVDIARSMTVGFLNYPEIYARLLDMKARIDKCSTYSDTPEKLIDGMLNELEIRGLHTSTKV